jgi:hypothetical protein
MKNNNKKLILYKNINILFIYKGIQYMQQIRHKNQLKKFSIQSTYLNIQDDLHKK